MVMINPLLPLYIVRCRSAASWGERVYNTCKFRENIDIVDTQSSPSMPPCLSSPPRCIKIAIPIAIIVIIEIIMILSLQLNRNHCDDCNHLNLQVQAANTGPAKYKGLTDVVFSLYRFAPFKFLIHLILCIIVVRIMTTTNVSSRCHHHHHHFLFFHIAPTLSTRNTKVKKQGGWSEKHLQRECCNCCKRSVPFFKSSVFFLRHPIFRLLMFFLHGSIQTELY